MTNAGAVCRKHARRKRVGAKTEILIFLKNTFTGVEYGFPLLHMRREKAQAVAGAAAVFRERSITVSLQIANTVGHGEYMKSEDNAAVQALSLEKLVGHDGTTADYAFCWNGKNLSRSRLRGDLFLQVLQKYFRGFGEHAVFFPGNV